MRRMRGRWLLLDISLIAIGFALGACEPIDEGSGLPKPTRNIAYLRSVVEDDNGLYAIDVENDQVIGGPLSLGGETRGPNNSTAMAPMGRSTPGAAR